MLRILVPSASLRLPLNSDVSLQMPRTQEPLVPIWKQVIVLACALYCLLVWIVPLFMVPFVNELPFVQERDIYKRLMFSAIGTLLVVVVLVSLGPQKMWHVARSQEPNGPRLKKLRHWIGVMAGITMFTYTGAWLSGNIFGLISRALPCQPYKETVVLDSVEFNGSKYRSASLRYKSQQDGEARYLVLSRRLFDYPRFAPGDVLELSGEESVVGVYIKSFRREG